jgi:anhydro-N-acetylmuramic acid kinase
MDPLHVIGLMSGTSMDGIDAVLVRMEQDVETLKLQIVGHHAQPYSTELQTSLQRLLEHRQGTLHELCVTNYAVGRELAAVATALMKQHHDVIVDLIASHGQTIWHQPMPLEQRSTLQLGTPAFLAAQRGVTTVHDFRAADIAAGGQGAPLVPLLDHLLFQHPTKNRVLLNIGGIANITWLPACDSALQPMAFDTGPGNSLIDSIMSIVTRGEERYDRDGRQAGQGTENLDLLTALRQHPPVAAYLQALPPKSTGRELFGQEFVSFILKLACERELHLTDLLATVTAYTAGSIAEAITKLLPGKVDEIIASGGGTRNLTLMKMLAEQLPGVQISITTDYGLPSQQKEALAFAVLGYHTLFGWPGNVPACTGACEPVVLGSITPGANYRALMELVHQSTLQPPRQAELTS